MEDMIKELFKNKSVEKISIYDENKISAYANGFLTCIESVNSNFGISEEGNQLKFLYAKGETIEESLKNMINRLATKE